MIYLTGDTHGTFIRIETFCKQYAPSASDVMVILGDAGINYQPPMYSKGLKKKLAKLPITLFCVHGNHEDSPQNIPSYHEKQWNGGMVLVEDDFPNLLFAVDGEIYCLDGVNCLVIGGAYSVDKYYRLERGYKWFSDEQPSDAIKQAVEAKIAFIRNKIDVVFSHTCPKKYIPTEMFLSMIDQSTVDNSTEEWLDGIEARLSYRHWYCGHYHTDKSIDKLRFLYNDIIEFDAPENKNVVDTMLALAEAQKAFEGFAEAQGITEETVQGWLDEIRHGRKD